MNASKPESFPALRLARFAMGTRFEIALAGEPEAELRAAGEEALDEIELYGAALDLFRKDSFLSFLNEEAPSRPLRVDADLFDLLECCRAIHGASEGFFDVTVGSLMACWGFHGQKSKGPSKDQVLQSMAKVGFEKVELDGDRMTVRYRTPGMRLDFGAVAKGFALDRAVELLEEGGIRCALLHGGTSTGFAMGSLPGASGWKVGIKDPSSDGLLKTIKLRDCAFSVSAPHGRTLEGEGKVLGHVMDPRSGEPARSAGLCAVVSESAARADAWSTALLAAGPELFERLMERAGDSTALLCFEEGGDRHIKVSGRCPEVFMEPDA